MWSLCVKGGKKGKQQAHTEESFSQTGYKEVPPYLRIRRHKSRTLPAFSCPLAKSPSPHSAPTNKFAIALFPPRRPFRSTDLLRLKREKLEIDYADPLVSSVLPTDRYSIICSVLLSFGLVTLI